MKRYAVLFTLVCAACGTVPTVRDVPTQIQVREEFKTCYRVGSKIRRLPEECAGPKEIQVREH